MILRDNNCSAGRQEQKYIISEADYVVLAKRLDRVLGRDVHCETGPYSITTLYFDWKILKDKNYLSNISFMSIGSGLFLSNIALLILGIFDAALWGVGRTAPIIWGIWGIGIVVYNLSENKQLNSTNSSKLKITVQ